MVKLILMLLCNRNLTFVSSSDSAIRENRFRLDGWDGNSFFATTISTAATCPEPVFETTLRLMINALNKDFMFSS